MSAFTATVTLNEHVLARWDGRQLLERATGNCKRGIER